MDKGQTSKSNPAQPSSPPEGKYVDGVFVSYGWVDESERTVNELEQAFEKHGIHIVRDKRDLPFRSSIKEFEERIGRGQSVVLVISDKYLRSEHCMYELLEVSKNRNLRERIFPIVLPDARIYNPVDRLSYVRYWDGRIQELRDEIKKVDVPSDLDGIHAELNKFVRIRASFDHLTDTLRDMNALTPELHAKDDYAALINAVKEFMAEEQPGPLLEPVPTPPPPPPVDPGYLRKVIAMVAAVAVLFIAWFLFSQRNAPLPIPEASPTSTTPFSPTATQVSTATLTFTPTPPVPIRPPCTEHSLTRYGFDCGFQTWLLTEDDESKAVTAISTAQVPNQYGQLTTVMVLTVDFTGAPTARAAEDREKGEVEVDLSGAPPAGYAPGLVDDLAGKTITAYVKVSKGASGDPDHLNGFQLFLRDEKFISCYGNWTNIRPNQEENWFRVVWTEPPMEEKLADAELAEIENRKPKCDPEFNINKPMILGLKIAVGTDSEAEFPDLLTVYLDDIDWVSAIHIVTPAAP